MRQKFIDNVYMREVIDKEWYLEKDEKLNKSFISKFCRNACRICYL